jgi:hypothetical protein
MSFKVAIAGMFTLLSVVFWLVNPNLQINTLVCIFYALFTGFVWNTISEASDEEELSWKHVLSPFLLVLIMMTAGSMKMIKSAETVMVTAIALIHIRAAVFSFNRFQGSELIFSLIQLFSFLFVITYLFQSNILSITIESKMFYAILLGMATLSMVFLAQMKRKWNATHREKEVELSPSDS